MEIRWSPLAAEDLEQIRSFIERDNPDAALRVITTIYEGCYRLTDFHTWAGNSRGQPEPASSRFHRCHMWRFTASGIIA